MRLVERSQTAVERPAPRQPKQCDRLAPSAGLRSRQLFGSAAALLLASVVAHSQIGDQVVVYGKTAVPVPGDRILRFDRKLNMLGVTLTTGAGAAYLNVDSGI